MKRFFAVLCALILVIMAFVIPVSALGTDDSGTRPYYNFFNYTVFTNAESVGTYQVGNTSYPFKMVANADGSLLSFTPTVDGAPQIPNNYRATVSVSDLTWNDLFPFTDSSDRLYWSRGVIGTNCFLQVYVSAGSLGDMWVDVPLNSPFYFSSLGITRDTPVRLSVSFNWQGQSNIFSPGMYTLSPFEEVDEDLIQTNDVNYSKSIFVSYNSTVEDYGNPYNDGYQAGLKDGEANRQQAYQDGVVAGRAQGIAEGKAQGIAEASEYSFFSLINAVVSVPIQALTGLLNFDIFGYNMLTFFGSVVTLILCIWIIRTFLL